MTASLYQSGSAFSPCDCVMRLTVGAQMAHGKLSISQSLANKTLVLASARREITFITKSQRTFVCSGLFLRDDRSERFYLESVGRIPLHRLRHPNGRPASDPCLLSTSRLRRLNLIFCMHRKERKQARRRGKRQTHRFSAPPQLEPGALTDLELMRAIQAEDPDALSQLYDRYNGILKALILRVIHNEAEADDLLQEIFMEIWNQARNFSAQKGKPLGWMVTLARRRAI